MIDPVLRPLWHMGALHPYEQALTLLLAFGPFVVLALVVRARRREDAAEAADPGATVDAAPLVQTDALPDAGSDPAR